MSARRAIGLGDGRDAARRKVRGNKRTLRSLDTIPSDEIVRAGPWMARVFTRYVLVAAGLHALVIAATVAEAFLVPWWTLYFRIIVAVRLALLLWIALFIPCCSVIPVVHLYRDPAVANRLRASRRLPALALWLALSYVDYYVFRIPALFLDIASPLIPSAGQPVNAAVARVAVDLLAIAEFGAALHFVYDCGILSNVNRNLRARRDGEAATV